ncbi:hypothetical protein KKG83_00055 [Candidatus Micrarchaeota archaeon]|nr:hypothetical protein [Candidatus Micrarchaeota archaeon]MBU2475844.1 hypothetical protein [Candidatus Micrarchaeota archaeon]
MKKKKLSKKELIKKLLNTPVKNIKFSGKKISFEFFENKITDLIELKKEDHVAEWSRRHKKIFIDKKFSKKDLNKSFKALCVHEAVEKFLAEKMHFNVDNQAHLVATRKEKEFLKKLKGNWRSHELIVYWNWHKQGEH